MFAKLADSLHESRFYGSKSQPITGVEVLQTADIGNATWCIARIHREDGSDIYQLLLDADGNDVLAQPEVATAFGNRVAIGATPGILHTLTNPIFPNGLPGRSLGAEQSNTSLVFGDSVLMKVFRKLQPGVNPDVELLSGLTEHGCTYVPQLRGWVSTTIQDEEYVTVLVQDFAHQASPGWERALDFAGNKRSFAQEATLLGTATREVHDTLAKAFGTQRVSGKQIAQQLQDRLESLAQSTPELQPYVEQAREIYHQLHSLQVPTQRVHGDYHLGQVLRNNDHYLLIDFEGEPARPLAERCRPDCAIRDLAGMLRSFDYAAKSTPGVESSWADDAATGFLEGYGFIANAEQQALLDAYLVDKLLYEVSYELNNRPDWVRIPRGALEKLIGHHT